MTVAAPKNKISWFRPDVNTKFHIDYEWWEQSGRNFRLYLRDQLCAECRDRFPGSQKHGRCGLDRPGDRRGSPHRCPVGVSSQPLHQGPRLHQRAPALDRGLLPRFSGQQQHAAQPLGVEPASTLETRPYHPANPWRPRRLSRAAARAGIEKRVNRSGNCSHSAEAPAPSAPFSARVNRSCAARNIGMSTILPSSTQTPRPAR